MPKSLPPLLNPLPLPLREALRRLRYVVLCGGQAARDIAVNANTGPGEGSVASRVATTLLEEMGQLAARVDDAASSADLAIGQTGNLMATLREIYDSANSGPTLTSALYTSLTLAMKHLGVDVPFVSELAAHEATQSWKAAKIEGGACLLAAHLALMLDKRQVIRGSSTRKGDGAAEVAIFGVMLWLLVARHPDDSEVALVSATDIALAVKDRVTPAFASHDLGALVALLDKYYKNV